MSKSILVIDTPSYCIDCPCRFAGTSGQVWYGKENKELLADDIQTFKPDWCPPKELPQEINENETYTNCEYYRAQGYSTCIDEILKGANRNE